MVTVSRYVGDMLAWLHQSCPGEAESVHHLLKLCDKVEVTRYVVDVINLSLVPG